jgi:hypothetical protein
VSSGGTLNINGYTLSEGENISVAGKGAAGQTSALIGSGTIQGDLILTADSLLGGAGGSNYTLSGAIGDGALKAVMMNAGLALSPGASPGTLTLDGNLTLDGADLLIDIWGDGGAGVDHELVSFSSGSLSLLNAPTIKVDLNNTFDPALDSSYTIISGIVGWSGDWNSLVVVENAPAEWTSSGKSFRIDQGSVMLTVIPEPNTLGLLLVIGAAAILKKLRMR